MGASAQDSNKIFEEPVREFKCPICFDFYPADLVVQCQPKHDVSYTYRVIRIYRLFIILLYYFANVNI